MQPQDLHFKWIYFPPERIFMPIYDNQIVKIISVDKNHMIHMGGPISNIGFLNSNFKNPFLSFSHLQNFHLYKWESSWSEIQRYIIQGDIIIL